MPVLVIIPDDGLRDQARELLGPGRSVRARDYIYGMFVSEQNFISDAILWSPPGLDREVLLAILHLRRRHRDVRIFVVTPERVKAGNLGYMENMKVDGYGIEAQLARIIEEINGVPIIVEREQPPPTSTDGSTPAAH